MKTYLEIKVPITYSASWLEQLRNQLSDLPVRWQQGYYHITMAFLDYTPDAVQVSRIVNKWMAGAQAPIVTFDHLDAFGMGGDDTKLIIYLTASDIPAEFNTLVDNIRRDLADAGCVMQSDFRLHVTLGRLYDARISLQEMKERLEEVAVPRSTFILTSAEYREFRGQTYGVWTLEKLETS